MTVTIASPLLSDRCTQEWLVLHGYSIRIDRVIGPESERTIRNFQRAAALPARARES
jgi:hypothetical protein